MRSRIEKVLDSYNLTMQHFASQIRQGQQTMTQCIGNKSQWVHFWNFGTEVITTTKTDAAMSSELSSQLNMMEAVLGQQRHSDRRLEAIAFWGCYRRSRV